MTKTIPLAEASEAQLRKFAETHLGLDIHPNAKLETVRAKVAQAWGKDEIQVEDESVAVPFFGTPPQPVTAAQQPPAAAKVRIILQRTDEAGGDEPVFVSVNGRGMLVPRGEPVDIPVPYFEVLQNAVKDVYESLRDGGMNPVPRQVPAYPFQRVA